MKLFKVLIPSLSVASIAAVVAPSVTSCGCSLLRILPQNLMKIAKDEFDVITLFGFNDGVDEGTLRNYKVFSMPDCVQKVNASAFYDETKQKSTIPDTIKELKFSIYYLDTKSNIAELDEACFKGAPFEKITFPYVGTQEYKDNISFDTNVFDGCDKLNLIDFSALFSFTSFNVFQSASGKVFGSAANNKGTVYIPQQPEWYVEEKLSWEQAWRVKLSGDLGLKLDDDHWKLEIKK